MLKLHMARKLIKKPQGLHTMSFLNTDNKVDIYCIKILSMQI